MRKIFRIGAICAIICIIFAAIISSVTAKTPNSEKIWDQDMTIGNIDAKNYFIIYSDIACPYCVAFENAIIEHEEDFKKYIEEKDILIEVRLSDFLYEYGETHPISSRYSAEAVYCAKKEGKFWDYYNLAITEVWANFFRDFGKGGFDKLNKLGKDYWIDLGKNVGLGDDFASCVNSDEPLKEIVNIAAKTTKFIHGMPYFKFNNYVSSGFDLSWGYEYVLMYFNAGLSER